MTSTHSVGTRGRPRSSTIDAALLAATCRQLAEHGYAALSLAAIAEEAGTTPPAIYRRWPTKAALAACAMATLPTETPFASEADADPFDDLVAELADFRRGVSMPGRLSLVGTMLQTTTDPETATRYRARVIAPRRERLRAIIERAITAGLLDPNADVEVALTMLTGSWYSRCLAGDPAPANWPRRAATLVWRSLGGTPPSERRSSRAESK